MRRILLGVIALSLPFLLLLNVRLHRPGDSATVQAQLRHLQGALEYGAADEMQRMFPEGYVFTWALYGLASARLAGQLDEQDARRAHLLSETRRALAAIHSEAGRAVFVREMDPPYGVFHASWALYVRAEYVRAAGRAKLPPAEVEEFSRECDRFGRAVGRYGSPFLESYPEQVWPADTAPGIAALGIHDAVVAPRYGPVIRRWVAEARARQHPELAALSHTAEPRTGRPTGVVRGESLALMSRLLVDADPQFAREQYAVLRARFLDDVLGVPGFLEYPRGMEGKEDVDTGPLVFGFSGPAVVVGAAAARVHGDMSVANALLGWVEVIGMPRQFGKGRVYAGGTLPIGDAFIAWARTAPAARPAQRTWEPLSPWWYLPFHAFSTVVGGLLVGWGVRIVRPRRGRGSRAASDLLRGER
jgi:hypothetical protein